jgi:peptidyl-prolyl cis-trans isomerase SurA
MKLLLPLFFIVGFLHPVVSQTLFTYGDNAVSKDEFMRAFEKNNTNTTAATREKDIRNYLELYTRFKLKVAEAYAMKLDTVVSKQGDVQNFRRQLEEPFMTDMAEMKRLSEEAFSRSLKDIHLAHIFIPYRVDYISNPTAVLPYNTADSIAALKKINEAYERIKKGDDFGTVAIATSADPSAATTRGDMGWITLFSLPYSLENIAYSLTPGKVSAPFPSSAGYHIFKNMEERPALGKMKVSQILIAFDHKGGPTAKASAKKLADSLHGALTRGVSFDKMAMNYSYDKLTSMAGGLMPPVSVGVYEKAFEDAVL